jgi:hypothetical protein
MDGLLRDDLTYVVSTEEILWGGVLLAVTIAIHGLGMLLTLRVARLLTERFPQGYQRSFLFGVGILMLAAWMIVLANCAELLLWAGFYVWCGAVQNPSAAFYYALVNYTTLNSGYLPQRWRLLEGVCAMAGLLTMAWSTGVLVALAQQFQRRLLGTSASTPRSGGPHAASDRPGATGADTAASGPPPR